MENIGQEGLSEEATLNRDLGRMALQGKKLQWRGCCEYSSSETQAGFMYVRNSEEACVAEVR